MTTCAGSCAAHLHGQTLAALPTRAHQARPRTASGGHQPCTTAHGPAATRPHGGTAAERRGVRGTRSARGGHPRRWAVAALLLQLYLWNRTSFIVPIFGDPLVPAAPRG